MGAHASQKLLLIWFKFGITFAKFFYTYEKLGIFSENLGNFKTVKKFEKICPVSEQLIVIHWRNSYEKPWKF